MITAPAIIFKNVEKSYGALRPLRVRDLEIASGATTMIVGFDRPAAETFINLVTGATLPDVGDVVSLGTPTRDIADGSRWLAFVEQFGIVSDRVVLLDMMTAAQNLALSFDLDVDPIVPDIMQRVRGLASDAGIGAERLDTRVGEADPLLQARVRLARALAFDPAVLILEHPTATLSAEDTRTYARTIRNISNTRQIAIVGLTADRRFAGDTRGRLLVWQPATGEFRDETRRKFWRL